MYISMDDEKNMLFWAEKQNESYLDAYTNTYIVGVGVRVCAFVPIPKVRTINL